MRSVKDIPVFFHNLGGYDSHIIFKSLNKVTLDGTPTVIAKSMEKFVCFKIHKLHFKDTLQFLGSSLDKLVSNLAAKTKNGQTLESIFPNLDKYFQDKWGHIPKEGFELLTRKGVYPYEYMDDFSKMEETSLPPKEKFFNDLTKKHISNEDYSFVQKLWNTFQLKNLGELHDLYMESDVLLLCDVFEGFRNWSMLKYRLDPAHYNTAPGLSWSAALRLTGQELEIPSDPDTHLFFDKSLTGCASEVKKPYAKANNEHFEHFDRL